MSPNLFSSVPNDYMNFGLGDSFDARGVSTMLGLRKEDVAHLAEVSLSSVRYDENIPARVRERLEEVAQTINLVAQAFDGDVQKTVTWFKLRNPMLGDVAPRDMIRLGRYERLRKFIINAMTERNARPH
jgi:Asp-tRNA(Asn)/Glu-tRNA(Gln) amidotransferase C subunit